MIYQTYYEREITVNALKTMLIQLYSKYVDSHKSKVYDILRKQNGKTSMINKVIRNKLTTDFRMHLRVSCLAFAVAIVGLFALMALDQVVAILTAVEALEDGDPHGFHVVCLLL